MAEKITDREIYALLDQAHGLFKDKEGITEGGDAVIKMFKGNTDLIQRAMLIMLSESRRRSEIEP